MEENENNEQSLFNKLVGTPNVEATIKVKLEQDQFIYLAMAVVVGVLLGTLFGDILKKMLGTT